MQLCTADLGFQSAATYDVEMWAPGSRSGWRSARARTAPTFSRAAPIMRFRRNKGGKPEFVHALNGSGLGLPRTLIAVLENYQQADGSDSGARSAAAVHGRSGRDPAAEIREV